MSKERWFLMTKGLSRAQAEQAGTLIAITRDAVWLLDLVPYGRRDVRGLPRERTLSFAAIPLPTMIGISGQSATATIRTGFHGIPF